MKRKKITPLIALALIALGIACVVMNFVLVFCWIKGVTDQALVATIISGWVSGISTLLVGIIALLQTKKYNDLNDKFVKKQYSLDKCRAILQSRILFVDNLKRCAEKYMKNCNPSFMELGLANVSSNPSGTSYYIEARRCITNYLIQLKMCHSELMHVIELDYNNSEQRNRVMQSLGSFFDVFISAVDTDEKIDSASSDINRFMSSLLDSMRINELYAEVEKAISSYVVHSDMDINEAVFYKNDDAEYLEKMFSPKNEDENWKTNKEKLCKKGTTKK